jgi:hypothetical protein
MYDGKWKMGNGKLVRRSLGEGGRLVFNSPKQAYGKSRKTKSLQRAESIAQSVSHHFIRHHNIILRRQKADGRRGNDFGREDLRLGEKTKSKIVLK